MGGHYVHQCNQCGYSFETSGPWEFYRTEDGNIEWYGHLMIVSDEAEKRGYSGCNADVYCPQCDRVSNVILYDFKEPIRYKPGQSQGEAELRDEYQKGESPVCPRCGGKRLILDEQYEEKIKCPRCATGTIVSAMDWIS